MSEIDEAAFQLGKSSILPKVNSKDFPMPECKDMRRMYTASFDFYDEVYVGSDESIVGIVTGVAWHSDGSVGVQCHWFDCGVRRSDWFDPKLLKLKKRGNKQ